MSSHREIRFTAVSDIAVIDICIGPIGEKPAYIAVVTPVDGKGDKDEGIWSDLFEKFDEAADFAMSSFVAQICYWIETRYEAAITSIVEKHYGEIPGPLNEIVLLCKMGRTALEHLASQYQINTPSRLTELDFEKIEPSEQEIIRWSSGQSDTEAIKAMAFRRHIAEKFSLPYF